MFLPELHTRFVREKTYLDNVSPKTVRFYRQSFGSFIRLVPSASVLSADGLTPDLLDEYVIAIRESRTANAVSINTYATGLNCFFSWLHSKGHMGTRVKIRKLKVDASLPKTVDGDLILRLVQYRSNSTSLKRVHAVVCTVLDTGLRVNEVLTVPREAVNLDNLTIRVMGKGRRERVVPFSPVLRRILVRWLGSAPDSSLAFPNKDGLVVGYRNAHRDYSTMCRGLGVARPGGFHRLRHTFASEFVRNNGNSFHLQQILGHRDIRTTMIYVHSNVEDLRGSASLLSSTGRP